MFLKKAEPTVQTQPRIRPPRALLIEVVNGGGKWTDGSDLMFGFAALESIKTLIICGRGGRQEAFSFFKTSTAAQKSD